MADRIHLGARTAVDPAFPTPLAPVAGDLARLQPFACLSVCQLLSAHPCPAIVVGLLSLPTAESLSVDFLWIFYTVVVVFGMGECAGWRCRCVRYMAGVDRGRGGQVRSSPLNPLAARERCYLSTPTPSPTQHAAAGRSALRSRVGGSVASRASISTHPSTTSITTSSHARTHYLKQPLPSAPPPPPAISSLQYLSPALASALLFSHL
ncbi:hypothetical protein EDC01DRAFT_237760 [Geopyxis carbonaria]|nr:hypothetical protein EDC01DRAFT_237760 [Geopyxis carbonaria]